MSGTQVTIQLHFISTHAGELVFTRVQLGGLANVGGAWQLDIEDGDPTRIGVLEQDTKILAKKFSQEELKNINLGHGTSIRGYARSDLMASNWPGRFRLTSTFDRGRSSFVPKGNDQVRECAADAPNTIILRAKSNSH